MNFNNTLAHSDQEFHHSFRNRMLHQTTDTPYSEHGSGAGLTLSMVAERTQCAHFNVDLLTKLCILYFILFVCSSFPW